MSIIQFPGSPTLYQTFTVGSKTWIWNGYAWDLQLANISTISSLIQTVYNQANTASSNTIYTQGVDNTQNTRLSTVEANTIYLFGALNATNTNYASSVSNANTQLKAYVDGQVSTINGNISYVNGVDLTQNTNITIATNLAQGGYNKANGAVQTGFTTISANGNSISPSSNADTLTITSASANGINILNPTTKTIDLGLRPTGVSSGSYGGSTSIPVINVDQFGRITSASTSSVSTTINLAANTGTGSIAGGGTLTVSGSNPGITTSVSGSTLLITNSGVTSLATGSSSRITVSSATGGSTVDLATVPSITAGSYSYPSLQVDSYGRITSISNQTPVTSVSGTGTVSGLTLTGTVTSTGSLTLGGTLSVTASNFSSQTANYFLAAPNGSSGTPTFRGIVAADIPTLNQNTTGSAGSVPASGITGTTLASGVTGSSLTSVGTITSGTWSGSFGAVSGASLTSLTAGNLTGTIPSGVLGNSTLYVGTTAIALNRSSASQTLTGVSIDGSSGSVVTTTATGVQSSYTAALNTTTPGTGTYGLHFNGMGTVDYASGITWASTAGTTSAQAGIYVQSSGSYGTKMYIATTDAYVSGSKTAVSIDHTGLVNFVRQRPTYAGNVILDAGNYSTYASPVAGSSSLTTTGTVTSGTWSGSFGAVSGASLTSLTAGNLTGTIPSGVLGNSTHYVGTTAIALNRASASQSLTGVSIDGSAGSVAASGITGTIPTATLGSGTASSSTYLRGDQTWQTISGFSTTDDTSTNASYYPVIATTAGGSTAKTSSTKLYFNPSTGTLSSTIFNSLSDENQKENIKKIDNATDIINRINGYEFNWKDNGQKSSGVIAQQLEQILPHLVTESEGTKSVNYAGIIGYLIEGMKEQQKQIDELKSIINSNK